MHRLDAVRAATRLSRTARALLIAGLVTGTAATMADTYVKFRSPWTNVAGVDAAGTAIGSGRISPGNGTPTELILFRALDGTERSAQPGYASTAPSGYYVYASTVLPDGTVAGTFSNNVDGNVERGFILYPDGRFEVREVPNTEGTELNYLNAAGDIAGAFIDPADHQRHAFFWPAGGEIVRVDIGQIRSMNELGDVAGSVFAQSGQGYIRHKSGATELFTVLEPGPFEEQAKLVVNGIDRNGNVAGWAQTRYKNGLLRNARSFVRHADGRVEVFQVPDSAPLNNTTWAYSINDAGAVAGEYRSSDARPKLALHGFIRDATGHVTTVDVPGAVATHLYTAMENGTLIGRWDDTDTAFCGCNPMPFVRYP